jgi:spermidine/putrescine transport system ATP-binding protein
MEHVAQRFESKNQRGRQYRFFGIHFSGSTNGVLSFWSQEVEMSSMVEIRGISKHFGKTKALDNVSLNIESGQFFALIGPSGSGKSTLLHIIGGFIDPTSGYIKIGDNDNIVSLPAAKRPTTSVFQDYALFPHMSVEKNVGFGLKMKKVPRPEAKQRVQAALEMVGLPGLGRRRIFQLSGGQRQRVALARALVVEPKVLLLDEPLGALDLNLRRQMQAELLQIQKKIGTTFIHVTHDQEEAMSIADVIAVLNNGRIEDVGAPERVYLKPRSLFTADFMGDNNMFKGHIVGRSDNGKLNIETKMGLLSINGDADKEASVNLLIRPEQIRVGKESDRHVSLGKVKVRRVTFFGTHRSCTGEHSETGQEMNIRLSHSQPVSTGDILDISASEDDLVLLAS